jgi:hypothetical protein
MSMSNVQIISYPDLLDSSAGFNGWKSDDLFKLEDVPEKNLATLRNCCAIEFVFERAIPTSNTADSLFTACDEFTRDILMALGTASYLFKVEWKKQLINKLRSYKGLFYQKPYQTKVTQVEVVLDKGYSLFIGCMKVTEDLYENIHDLFYDSSTTCIIASERVIFNEQSLRFFVENFISDDEVAHINYAMLVSHYCVNGDLIFRIGGDGGDRYVSLQLFCLRNKMDELLNLVRGNILK